MPTRQGTDYHNMTTSNENPLPDLNQQVAQILELVRTMNQRIHTLEQGQAHRVQEIIPNNNPVQNDRDNNRDDRVLRNVRVDAPTFDGTLDPIKFLDWISEIEDYFEWYGLEDDRRVGLAKMKLLGQARTYWKNQEHIFRQRPGHRTATWAEMKEKLKAKYLPISFRQRMLDEWNSLKQGSKPASEYIAKFDEYMSRCDVLEDEMLTLSRFRSGLREDLKTELILREIYTIQDAFEMVQNFESNRTQPRRPDSNPRTNSNYKPTSSAVNPSRVNSEFNKGKSAYRPDITCHNCHKTGHYKSHCPERAMLMDADGNQVEDDLNEVEGEHMLDGEFSDEDNQDQLNIIQNQICDPGHKKHLSVVRCALSLPQQTDDWRRTAIL